MLFSDFASASFSLPTTFDLHFPQTFPQEKPSFVSLNLHLSFPYPHLLIFTFSLVYWTVVRLFISSSVGHVYSGTKGLGVFSICS